MDGEFLQPRPEVLAAARTAFWDKINKGYPEAAIGGMSIAAELEFEQATDQALKQWLEWNDPAHIEMEMRVEQDRRNHEAAMSARERAGPQPQLPDDDELPW